MEQASTAKSEPPAAFVSAVGSFPIQAFGYGSVRYVAFLEALLDGLWAYEATQKERAYAQEPLPAA